MLRRIHLVDRVWTTPTLCKLGGQLGVPPEVPPEAARSRTLEAALFRVESGRGLARALHSAIGTILEQTDRKIPVNCRFRKCLAVAGRALERGRQHAERRPSERRDAVSAPNGL